MKDQGGGERLDFLQALRGIAALAVVFFHARLSLNGPQFLDAGNRLFENAAGGVDLFFVISGFVMVHTTWNLTGGPRSAARFLAKRVARIWPVYVVAMFAFLLAEGTLTVTLTDRAVTLVKAFTFYPETLHGPPFFGFTPNTVGWTLTYEIWFYVLFAVALIGVRKRWPILVGMFLLFLVVVPAVRVGTVSASAYFDYGMRPAILDLLANSMVWEFLAGCALGALYRSRVRIRHLELAQTIAALAVAFVLWQQFSNFHNQYGMRGWGPGMIAMVGALALLHKTRPLQVPRWLIWLGDISFSLYLFHRVVLLGIPRLIPDDLFPMATGFGFVLEATVVSLVIAHWSWRLLEQRVSERFRLWLLRRIGPPQPTQ